MNETGGGGTPLLPSVSEILSELLLESADGDVG